MGRGSSPAWWPREGRRRREEQQPQRRRARPPWSGPAASRPRWRLPSISARCEATPHCIACRRTSTGRWRWGRSRGRSSSACSRVLPRGGPGPKYDRQLYQPRLFFAGSPCVAWLGSDTRLSQLPRARSSALLTTRPRRLCEGGGGRVGLDWRPGSGRVYPPSVSAWVARPWAGS